MSRPAPAVFTGSVADLFATLGLDSTDFSNGLRKARVEIQETSRDTLTLYGLIRQLETQVGPQAAIAAFTQLNSQLNQSSRLLFQWQNQVVPALRNANAAIQQQAAVAAAAGGGLGAPPGGGAGAGGGGPFGFNVGLVGALTQRFLIYQGLRLAVQGITSALHEADDITRRMDQTGWGSTGIQRMQLQVERLHMPVDQVTAAIARFEQKVDSGDLSLIKALDRLGIKYTTLRNMMARDPQGAFETVIQRMNGLRNQGDFSDTAFALFQDRSGKMLGFIREYARMKEDASKVPILSEDDRQAVETLNWFMRVVGQRFSVGIGRIIGAFSPERMRAEDLRNRDAYGHITPLPVGLEAALGGPVASHGLAGLAPIASHGGPGIPSAANAPPSEATTQLRELLDQFRSPHELAVRKIQEDWNTMNLLERQGVATHAQVIEFQRRVFMKAQQEAQEAIDAMIRRDVQLLSEFGAQGKRTTESMSKDFAELERVFRANRISVEEMTEATANYFGMLEENAARPALKEAIRMFEQGLIGPEELVRARSRAKALDTRTEAEAAFERGEIGPQELAAAQRRYRGSLFDFPPNRGQRFFLGPGGSIITEPVRDRLPLRSPSDVQGPQGSINIIPLDQFSDQMLRRWKQQGY